jgi:hypothetical protein
MPRKAKIGAVRKGQPRRLRRKFQIGDRARFVDIPESMKDPSYDTKSDDHHEMRTAELFRFCAGRVFTVYGFDRYGNVELHVGNSPAVRRKFGKWHTIWSEPEFLKRVGSGAKP